MINKMDDFLDKRTIYILLSILSLSTLFRFYQINFQSLWLDELYSIVPTDPKNSVQSIIEYCKGDQPPLFFMYLYYAFKFFGYNELVGRMASALIGVIGIPAIYLLAKECFGKTTGLFASLLTAINYFHIYYSQEVRFYGMAFLFTTLSYLFFIRAFKTTRAFDFIGYILCTSCLLYTHYFGLFIFGAQAITFFILLYYNRSVKFILLSILSGIAVGASFLPWLSTLVNDLGADVGWIKSPSPIFVAQYFYDYTGKDALTTLILIVFIYNVFKSSSQVSTRKDETKPILLIIVIWIVISYLVPYLRSITLSPMLSNRYTIVTLPAWIILFSLGWNRIRNVKLKYAMSVILVLSAIINLNFFRKHYTVIRKDQFREASQLVLVKNENSYPIYSSLAWHFNFYFRETNNPVRDMSSANLSGIEKFWLLQAHFTEEDWQAEINRLAPSFKVVEKYPLIGANAILFEAQAN